MSRGERLELITQLEQSRQSKIICFITGDRENVNTRIAPDVLRVFYRHLEKLGTQNKIELFIYTRGGDVLTPWRLVHLIREYTKYFNVLVPYRSYSAGTLICLGADEIVMSKMGELGPIDPSVVNFFNPQDPGNPSSRVPVNVEDVYSYFALVKEVAGLNSDHAISRAFTLMAERIHPLALGNVHRNYQLIRSLGKKIMCLRAHECEDETMNHIVDSLTEKLYAHNHMISRREAKAEIGLPIIFPSGEEEKLIWNLYEAYDSELKLSEPFNPAEILRGSYTEFEVNSGIIESVKALDAFIFNGIVERRDYPEKGQVNVSMLKQGWRTLE